MRNCKICPKEFMGYHKNNIVRRQTMVNYIKNFRCSTERARKYGSNWCIETRVLLSILRPL